MDRYNWLGRFYREGEVSPPPPPPPPVETFTQEQVNEMLAANKRNLQKQLADAQKAASDAAAVKAKLKEVQDSLLTKEELAKQEQETARVAYEQKLSEEQKAREAWEAKFKDTTFETQLMKAAGKHDAFDADQLGVLLKGKSNVVEETDKDGKPTGQFKVMTTVTIEGKPLVLPIDEAVGKLRESGAYPNQFKIKGQPGTGQTLNGGSNGGSTTGDVPPSDPKAFAEWVKNARKTGVISR